MPQVKANPADEEEGKIIHLEFTPQDKVLPCPCCGGDVLELCNTWTASYWIDCPCGLQMHDRDTFWKTNSMEEHQASKAAVIAAWNKRTPCQ